jgi:hypothetical protein
MARNAPTRGCRVKLPPSEPRYDQDNEDQTRRAIENAFIRCGGGEAAGAGLSSRRVVTLTTASLAPNAEEQGTLDVGAPTVQVLSTESDTAARLRLYANDTAQALDNARASNVAPTNGIGVFGEWVWATSHVKIITPNVILFNYTDPTAGTVHYTIQNKSGSTTAVEVLLVVVSLEV